MQEVRHDADQNRQAGAALAPGMHRSGRRLRLRATGSIGFSRPWLRLALKRKLRSMPMTWQVTYASGFLAATVCSSGSKGLSAIPHRRDRGRRHPNPYQRQQRCDVLERGVLASRNGAIPGSQMSTEWRSLGESNPYFSLERAK
jgi:hypothetical protein